MAALRPPPRLPRPDGAGSAAARVKREGEKSLESGCCSALRSADTCQARPLPARAWPGRRRRRGPVLSYLRAGRSAARPRPAPGGRQRSPGSPGAAPPPPGRSSRPPGRAAPRPPGSMSPAPPPLQEVCGRVRLSGSGRHCRRSGTVRLPSSGRSAAPQPLLQSSCSPG